MGEERTAYERAYSLALGALPAMFTRAACQLHIPDILHAHPGQPLSALQITSSLPFPHQPPPPPLLLLQTAAYLDRIMRFLCSHGVFKAHLDPTSSSPTSYSLTPVSQWLLTPHGTTHLSPPPLHSSSDVAISRSNTSTSVGLLDDPCRGSSIALDGSSCDADPVGDTTPVRIDKRMSLRDFILFQTCGVLQPPLQHLAHFILEGGEGPFHKAHGMDGWSFLNSHSEFSHLFNAGMACDADICVALLLQNYQGFNDINTLVDVGGGIGTIASSIVARYPSIRALNFDLPYVVATAPSYPGVEHIGGDMFHDIPTGDAIFLRSTLHTWDDESCIKILKNCHKALSKLGKLIIMDVMLSDDFGNGSPSNQLQVALDVLMMVNTNGGKERTKQEWEFILKEAKFQLYRVIELPCPQCIIEAFPTRHM